MKSVRRFDGKVIAYDRYRERYSPQVLLPILREHCSLTPLWNIADIGAGTGMLSDIFLSNGNHVTAVEPNDEMRQLCLSLHSGASLTVVDGTAEATGLPASSVELVSAGRAMHWFDPERSMGEFRRILKPSGWVALIAFGRAESGRENEALEQLLRTYSEDHTDTHAGYQIYRHLDRYLTRDYTNRQIVSSTAFDWESLLGLVMSLSASPSREDTQYPEFECALRSLFDRYAAGGRFTLQTRYWINLGRFAE